MDTGGLIKQARFAAGLSQRVLAERADVSRHALSRYECGNRAPSIGTLTAILAAAGWQIRAELEQLDADVRAAIARVASEPLDDRVAVSRWVSFTELARVAYRVEGLAAASLLGAPLPADHYDLAVADTPETFEALAGLVTEHSYIVEAARRRGPKFRVPRSNPEPLGAQLRAWLAAHCPDGTFWLRCAFSEARTRLAPPDDVSRHVHVETPHGRVRVAPVHEIDVVADEYALRVLRVLREMTNESGDGVAQTPSPGLE
ncbi:helix-turn-helix protein [Haloactinopolyspora alba]|uniref:Helix-turn-helix protein n=1 Tax=Haloactinopolyspora alba TaxID=648780 RepID=A0A2P8EFP3_9ACTN|nr:helix-turn-helix transcriptional regulator [Haloactinopolyspora alba]PSL08288.1 helix-turn-helix protein [Haloactinopolyspora alba]